MCLCQAKRCEAIFAGSIQAECLQSSIIMAIFNLKFQGNNFYQIHNNLLCSETGRDYLKVKNPNANVEKLFIAPWRKSQGIKSPFFQLSFFVEFLKLRLILAFLTVSPETFTDNRVSQ